MSADVLAAYAGTSPGRAVSCSEANAARIFAATGVRLRCRPALRSSVSIRVCDSRRPCSGLGAAASTANASELARSVPNAASAAG